jgi:hypothetical protein
LHKLEQRYGSLLKGQFFGARERKRNGEVAKPDAPKFSFDDGLQAITDTLGWKLGPAVRLDCSVTKLEAQYEVGFGRHRALMQGIESKAPGLVLAGHYRDGISLADSIVSATAAFARVDEFLIRSAVSDENLTWEAA